MLNLGEIDAIERQLRASAVAFNRRGLRDFTLVEVIDDAAVWSRQFESLTPINPKSDFVELLARSPLFTCAVASEIGFRFEGVGTVYWAKFGDALGVSIGLYQRQSLATAFEALASRYAIVRPSESAFSAQFSIISWPIANALLPIDLIAPVTRLLSRAPTGALPGPGRAPTFPRLRAWASAAEGARLTDWLRFEEPSARVLTALLTENRSSVLSQISFERVQDALAGNAEAWRATRAARARARSVNVAVSLERTLGWLSIVRDKSGIRVFANWPPLPAPLFEEARTTARSSGWRPRLWGTGGFLHAEFALGSGPFAVTFQDVPADDSPVYGDAAEIFGPGSEIATVLASRCIDWKSHMIFDPNHERTQAEQQTGSITGKDGCVWIAVRDGINGLPLLGKACGYTFQEADLSNSDHRALLAKAGLLNQETRSVLVRHPIDAICARPGVVSPERPFIFYNPDAKEGAIEIRSLKTGEKVPETAGPLGRPAVRAAVLSSFEGEVANVELLERGSLFEALVERRLSIRIDSNLQLRKLVVALELEIDGCLIARGHDSISTPITIPTTSPLLASTYQDRTISKLLEVGRGDLRILVGRRTILSVTFKRSPASVDWTGAIPKLFDEERCSQLVCATAPTPNLFTPTASIEAPVAGANAYGLKLDDGRIADPVQLFTPSVFNLEDFTTHFGREVETRLKFDRGYGICDMARARVTWARGTCTTLPSLAAKARIVRQFEEPLVKSLCGHSWWRSEEATKLNPSDPNAALWQVALQRGLASVPLEVTSCEQALFASAFRRNVKRLDPEWTITGTPSEGLMDEALNAAFSEAVKALHLKGVLLNVEEDDCDFGNTAEEWKNAADEALSLVRRMALVRLIAPSGGGRQLCKRSYSDASIAEMAEDLSSWTQNWALARGQLNPDVAASALQLWISPAACDSVDAAVRVLAADPFVCRAVRYVALRICLETQGAYA